MSEGLFPNPEEDVRALESGAGVAVEWPDDKGPAMGWLTALRTHAVLRARVMADTDGSRSEELSAAVEEFSSTMGLAVLRLGKVFLPGAMVANHWRGRIESGSGAPAEGWSKESSGILALLMAGGGIFEAAGDRYNPVSVARREECEISDAAGGTAADAERRVPGL